jgi:3-methylcrotonyl-CoA carboxylase alpha subunit
LIASILIANRGEIARRVIRTARRLGVRTIAVYSDADRDSPHVREAEEAVRIGPPPARESYLNATAILEAAATTGAASIHPGYGFLSENAEFAQATLDAGLVWVGPPPAAIRAMGEKDAAKRLMAQAGVPTTPGYLGEDQSDHVLAHEAAKLGWPVLIKAIAGGGGKGMRRVDSAEGFGAALEAARRESRAAFGDDRVLLERYANRPRHVEVQVFADAHGGVIHLFERDCSLQRRHQKVVEEAPAPGMSEETREAICEAAVRAARAVGYVGAGTVEFIADASEGLRRDRIWFMEMNTRLQVEHPVTEAITGLDLVEWQLQIASGEPLPLTQAQVTRRGWAMEARLYAEDPAAGFLPSSGSLDHFKTPDFVRVDTAAEAGSRIGVHYDPMIGKLVAFGADRVAAADLLARACEAMEVWPVRTNAGFLGRLLRRAEFRAGETDTEFIETHLQSLTERPPPSAAAPSVAAAALAGPDDGAPWTRLLGFRMGRPPTKTSLEYDGHVLEADIASEPGRVFLADPSTAIVFEAGEAYRCSRPGAGSPVDAGEGDGHVRAPMPGRIVAVWVAGGDAVSRGQQLVALEAMKMEHALVAPFDGVVAEAPAVEGAQVKEGDLLVRLEPPA